MAKPRWHHILTESQRYALRAIDEWNCSTGSYSEFTTYMHKAWHYLLHGIFHRDKIDYHYIDPKTGRHVQVDGDPKAWALEDCLKYRYPNSADPVRLNVELFVKLRNKIEHRYEHGLKIVTGGKAHALVINYEAEMTAQFGPAYSLADRLRFPVYLQAITPAGATELRALTSKLPKHARALIARYEAGLDQAVLDDLKYDFRVRLVPIVGPKTDADLAINFVKLEDLDENERKAITEAGRTGTVIIRDRQVEVTDKDKLRPQQVARLVEDQLPFEFSLHGDHTDMWRRLKVRPPKDAPKPYDTDTKYCLYNEAYNSYLYTPAWVKRIVKEIGTVEKYRIFFGREPRMKVTQLSDRAGSSSMPSRSVQDRPA